jgi:hypothetical protein
MKIAIITLNITIKITNPSLEEFSSESFRKYVEEVVEQNSTKVVNRS